MAIEFSGFDYPLLMASAAALVLLFNLVAALIALRRARSTAHASAALVAELAVYKDAAFSLGEHLMRRGGALQSGSASSGTAQTAAMAPGAARGAPASSVLHEATLGGRHNAQHATVAVRQSADARDSQQVSAATASGQMLDTEHAVELARRGASVDDLVAACDVSRTEAGLILAITRRGRSFAGRPLLAGI